MAGRGPAPKSAATRARRNKKSTARTLTAGHKVRVPELPRSIEWHRMAREEWRRIWKSPMATEFTEADRDGLLKLIVLVNDWWYAESPKERVALAQEIRLQRDAFGLTPRARAGLHWEVARAEEAHDRAVKRKASRPAPSPQPSPASDPRARLHAVK